jgi:chlorobactene glucosyltransferase
MIHILPVIITSLFILLILLIVTIKNRFAFKPIQPISISTIKDLPFISVLIPARNEEKVIKQCIESLINQQYPTYEIIVLDDNSTDETLKILESLCLKYPEKLKIVQGKPLPKDWMGKNYACHQLSLLAKGEYLIFTDADTIHESSCLLTATQTIIKENIDLLSLVPNQIMNTYVEKIIIPMMLTLYTAYISIKAIQFSPNPAFTAMNGQFMMFKKSIYNSINGHETVKQMIVEDIQLGKKIKSAGGIISLKNGSLILSCRMYNNASEIIQGFSKNIFAGFNYNYGIMIFFLVHLSIAYILPFILLPFMMYNQSLYIHSIFIILHILIMLVIQFIVGQLFSFRKYMIFLYPLTACSIIYIGCISMYERFFDKGSTWKNRIYH